ncbi:MULTISPECIES: hypothetical protein [unclassified Burkholderia]|uniref:hypothetical protein n=1 Tax=unclassified Burkholderia TaxID=2613784 RepID=UPI000F567A26|nr:MULTISPECIES: hypothetical protein [unclassified Burkholderia]
MANRPANARHAPGSSGAAISGFAGDRVVPSSLRGNVQVVRLSTTERPDAEAFLGYVSEDIADHLHNRNLQAAAWSVLPPLPSIIHLERIR